MSKTKSELEAENAQLRDLIAAIHEVAGAVPLSAVGGEDAELRRARDMLITIGVETDLSQLSSEFRLPAMASVARKAAARAVPYQTFSLGVFADGSRA
jgi:hypothetical protein